MKAMILYFSAVSFRADHKQFFVSGTPAGYVRGEVVEAKDLSDALDKARPQRAEVVLNTVEPIHS